MNDEGDQTSSGTPGDEGVRLIGAEEAARAAARDDVAERLPDGTPRFGDRPRDIVAGPPSMSFPLAGDVDPTSIERPVPKGGSLFQRMAADRGGGSPGQLPPPDSAPVSMPPPGAGGPELTPPSGPPLDAATGRPLGPAPELPHWADPPTGEVPSVVASDRERDESWASVPSAAPRWKDQASDWDDADVRTIGEDPTIAAGLADLAEVDDVRRPIPTGREPQRAGAQPPLSIPGATAGGGGGGGRDVQTAAVVGGAIALAFLVSIAAKPAVAVVLVTAVITLCGAEFFAAVRKPGFNPPTLLGLAAIAALPLATYWRGEAAMTVIVVLTVMFGMLWYVAGVGTDRPVANLAVTVFAVAWIGVLGSFAALMLRAPDGGSLLIATAIVAVAHDVGAFFGGRQFGHTPLSAASPNKTVEGFTAGLAASVLAAFLVVFVGRIHEAGFGDTFAKSLLLGIVVGVMTPLGDLGESLVKRDLRIKDMGSMLPGHGGVLDRFDGILFALPAAWYLYLLLL